MDLEASIIERLQKLRQWQSEQQKQLLKQQQIQRDILTQKQDSVYKALELSMQELDINEDVLNTNNTNIDTDQNLITAYNRLELEQNVSKILHNNELCTKTNLGNLKNNVSQKGSLKEELSGTLLNIDNQLKEQANDNIMSNIKNDIKLTQTSPKYEIQNRQFIIDGITPLSDKSITSHVCIDDLPIPSPKKDFHTLLEEKLKDCVNIPCEKFNSNLEKKVKKPFLKKGEGLSRFRLSQHLKFPITKTRSHSASFSSKPQSNPKHYKNKSKCNAIQHSKTQPSRNAHYTNLTQNHLSLKNVALPEKKLRSKSESNISDIQLEEYISDIKNTIELSTSDFQCGTQEESEEVRIFELLEEKAENSSFCSTSSAVIAFLQQSTPFKIKKGKYTMENATFNIKQETIPKIQNSNDQLVLKSNQACQYKVFNENTNLSGDLIPFRNKKVIQNDMYKSTNVPQDINDDNKRRMVTDIENSNEVDVSLHVRFSEYNEYKTIGLSDTSSISTESLITRSFSDEKVWSDSTPDTSNIEISSMPFEISQSFAKTSKIHNNKQISKSEQCNVQEGLTCETQTSDMKYNTNTHQNIFHEDESELLNQSSDEEQNALLNDSQNNLIAEKTDMSNIVERSKQCMNECEGGKINKYIKTYDDKEIINVQNKEKESQEINETIFTSELLKNRLLKLEQEINIFRKENAALSIQRKKLQEDHRNLHKEYAEKQKKLEEGKRQIENHLQDERKKLLREKAALENRMKDSQERAQQSKLERQEIQYLRQEVEKLKEEIYLKESRWNAAQSRQKCQMRILKMENTKLKQEVEKLQNLKKSNIKNKKKIGTFSNTKAIHQINKQLGMQLKETEKINDTSSDGNNKKSIEPVSTSVSIIDIKNMEKSESNCSSNKDVINTKLQRNEMSMANVAKKRSLYDNLIKEATSDIKEVNEEWNTSENSSKFRSDLNSSCKDIGIIESTEANNFEKSCKESNLASTHSNFNNKIQLQTQNDYVDITSPMKMRNKSYNEKSKLVSDVDNTDVENAVAFCQSNTNIDKKYIRQIQHTDGSIEYQFPNGNVKKVFPDQGLTRLIYYNGDIRETNKDGKIKYFYASTQTWHTTMPDGLEILEFTDGQVERRSHNGTVEVLFPDGSVRILELDGTERWTLPDGTLIQILTNGEKILNLPNGQQEIHTKTHKRREYPDGTTKFIYVDGTQETRYSNGRIRLKDKDGNLLMDSYQ